MVPTLIVILGLVVGSFLNVVIYRLHVGGGFVAGRSYCPHCKHSLATTDLVPLVSFILLRGRCRYCRKKISWQYPLVESATALLFLIFYLAHGLTLPLLVYAVYGCFLMVIFVFDLRYYLILDKVSVPAMVVAALGSLFILKISALHLLTGALIGAGFFLVQFLVSKGKWIGGGDIRLGAVMGLMLGYQQLLVALFIAYLLGSIIGIGLVMGGKKKMSSQIPFGTFLSLATVITFFIGSPIVEYYRLMF